MIHIDPDYINIFTQNQNIPIGLIISVLTLILLIIATIRVLNKGDNDELNIISIGWIMGAMLIATLIHFNPTLNSPKLNQDIAKYQKANNQTVRTKKADFDKTKEKLPEFTNTTLIKTADGLFQKELVDENLIAPDMKKPELVIISNQKDEEEISKIHKNFSLNIVKLPNKNDQPISAMITVFTSTNKVERYLIETNYHSLNQILQYQIRTSYDELNNKLYIE